jgi:transposase InsO family protein
LREVIVAYTRQKPNIAPPREELQRTIPGWGIDLDPAVRPSFPKEQLQETGAHWEFPERQPELTPRERSTEHKFLTPVFGTAQPLRGLSGAIRRYAYVNYSEAQVAHWLLLMLGDRVDVLESRVTAVMRGRPDNVIAETGVRAEFRNRAYRTRFGQHRADLVHQPIDLVLWAAPYVALAGGAYLLAQALGGRRRAR